MAERRENSFPEDDGRVVADMSEVERPNLYSFRRIRQAICRSDGSPERRAMPREDRRIYILAAVRAALLIGLCFAAGLAVVILIISAIGR